MVTHGAQQQVDFPQFSLGLRGGGQHLTHLDPQPHVPDSGQGGGHGHSHAGGTQGGRQGGG